MKIVLLQDVPKLGHKYEIKEVKPGYGRNFLIARGLAMIATKSALIQAEAKRLELDKVTGEKRDKLAKEATALEQVTIKLTKRANELGHLFDSIDENDLTEALRAQTSFEVETSWITLGHPIKEIGSHTIPVSHGEVKTSFQLVVEPEVEKETKTKVEAKKTKTKAKSKKED